MQFFDQSSDYKRNHENLLIELVNLVSASDKCITFSEAWDLDIRSRRFLAESFDESKKKNNTPMPKDAKSKDPMAGISRPPMTTPK